MTYKEFKAEIKKGLCGGYLLYGDEEYLKQYYLKEAVSSIVGDDDTFSSFNLVNIDEDSYSPDVLIDALSSFPMMAEKVCVVCSVNLDEMKGKDEFIDIISNSEYFAHSVLLVVCPYDSLGEEQVKNKKTAELFKKVTRYLAPVEFFHSSHSELKKWVLRHFQKEGLTADDGTLDYIVETSGPDMLSLGTEAEKLICYARSKDLSAVTYDAARRLCSDNGECGAFALTNAIVSGDRAGALEALKESEEKKLKASYVLSRISDDFTNILTVSLYMKDGMTREQIASKTGLHKYRVGRYMEAARSTDIGAIRAALDRCREADLAIKTSKIEYMALERLVCTMPAKKQVHRFR